MKLFKNLNLFKHLLVGTFGITTIFAFPENLKAGDGDVCPTSGSKTASELQSLYADDTCMTTPDRFEVKIFELGLCLSLPLSGSIGSFESDFTSCQKTMISLGGTDTDLAGLSTTNLPSASTRPANGTYPYAYILIENDIGIKGSYAVKNGNTYYSDGSSNGGFKISGPAENHTESLVSFDETFDPEFGPITMSSGGKVRALLVTDANVRASSGGVQRLFGIFETNSGSPITIDDSATGLQVELKVTNAGYTVNIDSNGVPEKFNSGPFKPVFTIIN